MIGFSRNHTGDRFYNPPAMRRQQQQQQIQQLQRPTRPKSSVSDLRQPDNRVHSNESVAKPSLSSPRPIPPVTNIDNFLESTTPVVPAQYLSKMATRGWRNFEAESYPYYCLGDLWESFKEWSAYGAGVPLILNGSESVVQYYVPYLSGIQLFLDSTKPSFNSRLPGEESDGDSCQDSSSDSSESDAERQSKLVGDKELGQHNINDANMQRIKRLSRDKSVPGQEGFSSDDGETCSQQNHAEFEYMETDPPFARQPLADKIADLIKKYPKLKTYRSCDLLPSSWLSVAWYPIYRIPMGPTLQDLDACFLTYHSLSTPFRNGTMGQAQIPSPPTKKLGNFPDGYPKLSIVSFGLASYKFKGSVWTPNGVYERQQASSLFQAADSWLRLLQANHPDYCFFIRRNAYSR